ncbi:PREDICTED: uncharacterized protein LOC104587439 [Nelumbo nucifera]|uniref:Uncharacterized protein n=2 Tax=Nelumbo nucifera TaxID=4432 RepID=A0A822YGE2_NELNU|nr:PREDICTED: uncharacterized protein LOC104587439 [Nelumbo nucifera]DAD30036.1 TPA_asm: hypothetical protein HUJ06_031504 [Nelumbo nucifera]
MAMGSSSSSTDPHNHPPYVNPSSRDSSSSRPLTTSHPPSSPSPIYTAQPIPVIAGKTSNPNPPAQMAKIQDPSVPPPQGILYPVASSGRGFIPKSFRPQPVDQLVTVANPGGFPPRSVVAFANQVRPFSFPPGDPQVQAVHLMRPPHMQPPHLGPRHIGATVSGPPIKSIPLVVHPKAAQFPSSTSDFNGYKELRDRSRDDTVVTIHDRKVRLSDGASLYALCRSWVRNGLPQESQPQFGEGVKLLPRPLPTSISEIPLPKKTEGDDEDEKKEDEGSVEELSAQELLQRHVKHAKKVRARLREERLQRIARYKQRLALLLPPPVEQYRNDAASIS